MEKTKFETKRPKINYCPPAPTPLAGMLPPGKLEEIRRKARAGCGAAERLGVT